MNLIDRKIITDRNLVDFILLCAFFLNLKLYLGKTCSKFIYIFTMFDLNWIYFKTREGFLFLFTLHVSAYFFLAYIYDLVYVCFHGGLCTVCYIEIISGVWNEESCCWKKILRERDVRALLYLSLSYSLIACVGAPLSLSLFSGS